MEIIELARALGEKLAESPQYKAFCETRDKCKENALLKAKLDEFKVQKSVYDIENAKAEKDEKLLDAVNSRMEILYGEITQHPEMKAYTRAEDALNVLMSAINMTITSYISPETLTNDAENGDFDEECGEGCTHDCSTCRGCH